MKSLARATLVGVTLLVTVSVGPMSAQVGYLPYRRPTVSPYINLVRPGTDPAVQYYGIVRPEVTFRNSIQQLQLQQGVLTTQQQDLTTAAGLAPTGHPTGFQTQAKYFMRKGILGAPTTAPTGPTTPARPQTKGSTRR